MKVKKKVKKSIENNGESKKYQIIIVSLLGWVPIYDKNEKRAERICGESYGKRGVLKKNKGYPYPISDEDNRNFTL